MEGKNGGGDTDHLGGTSSAAAELSSFPSCDLNAIMKIAVMSDLHLESDAEALASRRRNSPKSAAFAFYRHPPQPDADPVVLPGDVDTVACGLNWAFRHFATPTVVIVGNHDPYGRELFRVIASNWQKVSATKERLASLKRAKWTWASAAAEQARFIGATLWTDSRLYDDPQASMAVAQEELEDFSAIKIERGHKMCLLRPSDTTRLHMATVAFLHEKPRWPFDGTPVIVTHRAAARWCIAPKFENDSLDPNIRLRLGKCDPKIPAISLDPQSN